MSLISIFTDQIRNDEIRKYEGIVSELAARAREQGEEFRWTAHQVSFGSLSRMYYVSQHEDHADVERQGDPQALFTRVLGEKRGAKQLEEANECLVSSERALGRQRPELSYPADPPDGVSPIASVALIRARNGGQQAVEELLLKIAEAIPKTGEAARIGVVQALTGDMQLYWIVRSLNSLAELDDQSVGRDLLLKAYGQEEGERIFQSGTEATDQLEREITRYREDLSNPPT